MTPETPDATFAANLPVTVISPPSILTVEPEPGVIELPDPVPTLNVPCEILRRPFIVGEPACPLTVKFGLFSQKPPVAGIE